MRVRAGLNSEAFVDRAPRPVYAALLDDGKYLCHWRTLYRILHAFAEVRERRQHHQQRLYQKPELLAVMPKIFADNASRF
jgi:putative transposase